MAETSTITYETDIPEVKRALKLADKGKIVLLENDKKILIACELSKEQMKALNN